jgi:hypothetical protein
VRCFLRASLLSQRLPIRLTGEFDTDVQQTVGGKRRSRSVEDFARGPETSPNGSDNLLAEVCALISCQYTLFEALSCQQL